MDSILNSVKKLLGQYKDYHAFDEDVIIFTNAAIAIVNQLGVGKNGYRITDENNTWDEFLVNTQGIERSDLEDVKAFIALKVRMMFDTSTMSNTQKSATEDALRELEWRISLKENYEDSDKPISTYVTAEEVEEMINTATSNLPSKTYVDDLIADVNTAIEQVSDNDKVKTKEDVERIHKEIDTITNNEEVNIATNDDIVDDKVLEDLLESLYD